MLAPPWIPVPPPGYGGIEAMVAQVERREARGGPLVRGRAESTRVAE
jgi:hypothetical protein